MSVVENLAGVGFRRKIVAEFYAPQGMNKTPQLQIFLWSYVHT